MIRFMESRTAAGLVIGAAACFCAGSAGAAEGVTVAKIAPPDTTAILATDNWPSLKGSMDRSGLGELWREPDVTRFVEAIFESSDDASEAAQFKTWMKELDITWEDFDEPAGAVGAALFFRADADAEAGAAPRPHVLVVGDFGDGLEKNQATLVTMLEDMEKRGHVELKDDEYGGSTITTITIVEKDDAEEEDEPADPDEWQWEEDEEEPFDYDTVYLAGVDGVLLVGTELDSMEKAIDRVEGVEEDSLEGDDLYTAALAQHPDKPEAFGAVFFRDDLRRVIADTFGPAMMFFVPQGTDVADLFGLNKVQAVSIGQRFDTERAMAEQTWGLLVPEKKGLFTLLDEPVAGFVPPAFTGPDAASVTRAAVDLNEVFPLLRDMVASLPEQTRAQLGPWLDQVSAQFEPIFTTLGPEMYFTTSIQRPLSAESQRQVVAIRVGDAAALSNAIAPLMAQSGTEARDFQGNQLYDMNGESALGIGFGFLFMGPTPDVENAMRLASEPDGPRLAAEDRFIRATAPLGGESIVSGYSDLKQTMELAYWQLREQKRLWEEQQKDPAMQDQMQFMTAPPAWLDKLPPVELLLRHLGDSVYEIGPSPDGFRGRSLLLRPNNQG